MSTVVITGANRGLGLELARAFAGRGHTVIAGCRDPNAATELKVETEHVYALDVGNYGSIGQFVRDVGDRAIDVLINNAGIDARNLGAGDDDRDVLTQPVEHFIGQMQVNAVGPLLLVRGLLPHLRRSSNGRVVNVSSQVGSMEVAKTIGRDLGYAASKAALNMITVKLAARLSDDGIIVVALHPGYLRTAMGGPGAAMEAGDAARQIADLVDSLTPEQTGQFLRWDGTIHPW
jgi:NAD(P)-dependent dehydrogenase (short-subunit alcohol dehydrogenase family)